MNKIIISLMVFIPFFWACDDLFEPALENNRDMEALYAEPGLAQGLLGHAYIGNPLGGWSFNDVATDDAVSNDVNNGYRRIATGQWTSSASPMNGNWQNRRASLQYINFFIDIVDDVKWAKDPKIADLFKERMKGDAYGMRALYEYHLLLEHAGYTESGELLGLPILTEPEDASSNFNLPRNTFKQCMEQIYADVQVALDNLPLFYGDVTRDDDVPEKYKEKSVKADEYSRVFGEKTRNRMSGHIAEAIRAQATLLAASPAYSAASGYTYEDAANQMALVLSRLGANPVAEIDQTGHTWFENRTEITNLKLGINPKEILWRGNKGLNHDYADGNYPPTLRGSGRLNPTQNLVDAFPMIDGYPIGHPSSAITYEDNAPYNNRDPRLKAYIIYNGNTAGPSNTVINTAQDGPDENALSKTSTSTRTGYYMKKLFRQDIVRSSSSSPWTDQNQYKAFIRYTEIFLGFAEAANEAWGPLDARKGYSAYDVIKAIRYRAGIGRNNGDAYLESIKNDKDAMRELIRNERRLELCFEGHRFWDLRRWKVSITEPAMGMRIVGGNYTPFEVEPRPYADHMYHAPIPYSEILKFNALEQNKGW